MGSKVMKKTVIALALIVTASIVFSESFIDLFLSSSYFGRRTVYEYGATTKSRIELVYRWPDRKVVQVLSPIPLVWTRTGDSFFMGSSSDLRPSPLEIFDLEDLFSRELKIHGISRIEKLDAEKKYRAFVESPAGFFVAVITEDGTPERITRYFQNTVTELFYEKVEPLQDSYEEVISKYNLNKQRAVVNLPDELVEILKTMAWYTVSRLNIGQEQVVLITGMHKSGAVLKVVYATKEVNIKTEHNEKILRVAGDGYFVYVSTQDEQVYEETKEILNK